MRRRKILVLTPYPLLPAHSGGRLYALGTVAPVADEHEFHLLALANPAERDEIARGGRALRAEYAKTFASVAFEERPPIPHELRGRVRKLRHFLGHAAYRLPLMDLSYFNRRAVDRARQIIAEQRIDLLEIHHLHAAFYRRCLPDLPAVLINHNIEQDLWPFWPKVDGSAPDRWLWNAFGKLSRRNAHDIEIDNALRFDAKAFISTRDMARVPEEACPRFLVPMPVPPAPPVEPFARDRFRVLWIGGFGWPPNVEAIDWFLDGVWPIVRENAGVPVELHLVGSDPPEQLRARADGHEIFVHGYVEDVEPLRTRADAFVVPLRTGSGVRIKIVEALAAGLPVVSTAKGCEGLPLEPGDLLVADEPADFASRLLELAHSVELREELGRAGRAYAARHHAPEVVATAKRRVYQALESLGR
jgi:glycosyltransferase involved in cell wall biosynthesis